jgi:excisionase family DNA binding protein
MNNPLAVTVQRARELSGLGNTTIYALIRDKKLETVTVGRRRLVLFKSLESLLQGEAA